MSFLWDAGDAIYAKPMAVHFANRGKMLFDPATTDPHGTPVRIGDVGVFREGRFYLLFHAIQNVHDPPPEPGVNVPQNFQPLPYEEGAAIPPVEKKTLVRSDLGGSSSWGLEANVSVIEMSVEMASEKTGFASVYTKDRQYADQVMWPDIFQQYAEVFGQSWLEFGRSKGADNLVLITGLYRSRDFVTVASKQSSGKFTARVGFEVPTPIGVPVGAHAHRSRPTNTDHSMTWSVIPETPSLYDNARYIDHRTLEQTPEARDYTNSVSLRFVQLARFRKYRAWIYIRAGDLRRKLFGGHSGGNLPGISGNFGDVSSHDSGTNHVAFDQRYPTQLLLDCLQEHDAIGDPLACVAFHIAWICYTHRIDDSLVDALIPPDILSDLFKMSHSKEWVRLDAEENKLHAVQMKLQSLLNVAKYKPAPNYPRDIDDRLREIKKATECSDAVLFRDMGEVGPSDVVATLFLSQPDIEIRNKFAFLVPRELNRKDPRPAGLLPEHDFSNALGAALRDIDSHRAANRGRTVPAE